MRRLHLGLLALLTLALVPAGTAANTAASARKLLQEGKPLSGYALLWVEDADFAARVRNAGLPEYLDGTKTLAQLNEGWQQQITGLRPTALTRLQRRFGTLIEGLPQTYTHRGSVKVSELGTSVPVALFDVEGDVQLQALFKGIESLKNSSELSFKDRLDLVMRIVKSRGSQYGAGDDPGKDLLRVGKIMQTGDVPTAHLVSLMERALRVAGFEPKVSRSRGKLFLSLVKRSGAERVTWDEIKETVPGIEIDVQGGSIIVRKLGKVLERADGVVGTRSSVLLNYSPQVIFKEYEAGRKVHIFDPETGKTRFDGKVLGGGGNAYRVKYAENKTRVVTRQELDLLNAHLPLADGTVVKAAPHFYHGHDDTPRAKVKLDPKTDPYLRSFMMEMGVIGRAKDIPEEAKLNYLVKVVKSWMDRNEIKDSWEIDREFAQRHAAALLGEFMKNGTGVCRHQALLATMGMRAMGFHSRYVSGGGHATAEALLKDGRRMKIDPYFGTVDVKDYANTPESYLIEPIVRRGVTLFDELGGRPVGIPAPSQNELDNPTRARLQEDFQRMWSGDFRYDRDWSAEHVKKVPVRRIETDLVWFNPRASVSAMDIRAGSPLTAQQQESIEFLLGVERAPETDVQGQAGHPSNVGRAINPAPGAFGITIGDGRHQRSDLTVKGTGMNRGYGQSNSRGDGTLELTDALLDAEISMSLYEAGVRLYMPVAILRRRSDPTKALYWRMPVYSMVRADDLADKLLSPQEALKTVEKIAKDVSASEGREITATEFLESHYPRVMGENVGRMRQLGVAHGTIKYSGYGNSGVAEIVDFGRGMFDQDGVQLFSDREARGLIEQKEQYLRDVERVVEALNPALPEPLSLEEVRRKYEEGFERGQAAVRQSGAKVSFRKETLEKVEEVDLRNLVRGLDAQKSESLSREKLIEFLDQKGYVRAPEMTQAERALLPSPAGMRMERVKRFARREVPEGLRFAGAFLIKELMDAGTLKGKPLAERAQAALQEIATVRFWGSLGVFSVAARGIEALVESPFVLRHITRLPQMLIKSGLPLAAGMAATDAIFYREFRPLRVLTSAGSFMATGAGVDLVTTVLPSMLGKTAPNGWIWKTCKLGLTLFWGERLEEWAASRFLQPEGEEKRLRRVVPKRKLEKLRAEER